MIIKSNIITDETIIDDVTRALADAENYNLIKNISAPLRDEFIRDCAQCVTLNYETYDEYNPNYSDIVADMAKLYGYWEA